jgi:hypothetical protein
VSIPEGASTPSPPNNRDADSNVIYETPMPRHRRTVLRVFREELSLLKVDCTNLKRRRRSTPYLFSLGWSCLTGAVACVVGLVIYESSDPKPDHHVWTMYFVGGIALAAVGIVLLVFHLIKRRLDDQDVDDLMSKIDRIDYGSEVEN